MSRGSSKYIRLLRTIKVILNTCAPRSGRSWRVNQRNCMLGFVVKKTPGTSEPTSRQNQTAGSCAARPVHILRSIARDRAFKDDSCGDVASVPESPEFRWAQTKHVMEGFSEAMLSVVTCVRRNRLYRVISALQSLGC